MGKKWDEKWAEDANGDPVYWPEGTQKAGQRMTNKQVKNRRSNRKQLHSAYDSDGKPILNGRGEHMTINAVQPQKEYNRPAYDSDSDSEPILNDRGEQKKVEAVAKAKSVNRQIAIDTRPSDYTDSLFLPFANALHLPLDSLESIAIAKETFADIGVDERLKLLEEEAVEDVEPPPAKKARAAAGA